VLGQHGVDENPHPRSILLPSSFSILRQELYHAFLFAEIRRFVTTFLSLSLSVIKIPKHSSTLRSSL
jgi:hypothetical protein